MRMRAVSTHEDWLLVINQENIGIQKIVVNLPSRGEGWYSEVILLVEDDRPLMSCMCWRRLLEFSRLCSYRTWVRKRLSQICRNNQREEEREEENK
jgi:hypothetical protein